MSMSRNPCEPKALLEIKKHLHPKLKMYALKSTKPLYIAASEAIEQYLKKKKAL